MEVYSSAFSKIIFEPNQQLLIVSWDKDSQNLKQKDVKYEISKILDYIYKHSVKNIIIDSREYYFRDNMEIQNWINFKFIPVIMDSPVKKYGIILNAPLKKQFKNVNDSDHEEQLLIEYFTDLEEARKWIES